jgi:pyruvate/2-oxoglutarate dehydrogenase complex dihydrolipoamide acyltransferase (E2) component
MSRVDICLERETANDEFAVIVKIYEASGKPVQEGQHIFDVENSKATQELFSPATGILVHALNVGDEVDFGISMAVIVPPDEAASTTPPVARILSARPPDRVRVDRTTAPSGPRTKAGASSRQGSYSSRPPDRPPKFSRAARELISETGVDPASLSMEWVTADDLRKHSGGASALHVSLSDTQSPVPEEGGSRRISMRKRAEIQSLSAGAAGGMLSVLGVSLGQITVHREAKDIFDNRIIDLVIYEASRLMVRYGNLNSYFSDGSVYRHDSIVAGLALDDGGRLVVYGIENAERFELSELRSEILNALSRYMEHALTAGEMSRATFTVTDLSAEPLDFMLPLLPERQSCIIGVTRNAGGEFRLHVGFDHRVTEGREVAFFIGELRNRLLSFDKGLRAANAQCHFCEKSITDAIHLYRGKGLVKVLNAEGDEVYCCSACLSGW